MFCYCLWEEEEEVEKKQIAIDDHKKQQQQKQQSSKWPFMCLHVCYLANWLTSNVFSDFIGWLLFLMIFA